MASTNQSPQYQKAQGMFLNAKTNEEKVKWLEEMIRECPKHKSSEKMLANLKQRYIKLKDKMERLRKSSKGSGKPGIKKEDMQAVIVGFTNSGKSSLLSLLTKASPEISSNYFTTKYSIVGMMNYSSVNIQLIEIPAINSEYYESGLVNTADVVLIIITNLDDLEKILSKLNRVPGKKLIVFNIKEEVNERKVADTLKSKKYDFVIISTKTKEGMEELKEKTFKSFGKIRVFTKEPGKERSNNPIILSPNATVMEVASKIFRGSSKIKETKVWGPSSKFPGQKVGLTHQLKDMDILEFRTR